MWSYATSDMQNESYPVITVNVRLQRQGAFYVSLLVIPSVLLAVLVIFIFLIPPASGQRLPFGEDKITVERRNAMYNTHIRGSAGPSGRTDAVFHGITHRKVVRWWEAVTMHRPCYI